jgi:hypothetical protein
LTEELPQLRTRMRMGWRTLSGDDANHSTVQLYGAAGEFDG